MYEQVRAIKTLAWMNSISVLAPILGLLFGMYTNFEAEIDIKKVLVDIN